MGISKADIEEMKSRVPEQFRVQEDSAQPLTGAFTSDTSADIRAEIADTGQAMKDDIDLIKAEGVEALAGSRKIDTLEDLRALATVLEAAETEDGIRNALAGYSTRMIANYFAFRDERLTEALADGRRASRDAHYLVLLATQLNYWQQEFQRFDGYVDALTDYQRRLENGETFTKDELPPEVREAIDEYEEANPDITVDWNDPESIRLVEEWAKQNRDHAAKTKSEIKQESDAFLSEVEPSEEISILKSAASEYTDDPFETLDCAEKFNACAAGTPKQDVPIVESKLNISPEDMFNNM